MKYEWGRNWKFRSWFCCGGTYFDVECITWVFSRVTLSSWNSVSSQFHCCINWLRSSPCRNIWLAPSIHFWCGILKYCFSNWVCSKEKNSQNCSSVLQMDFLLVGLRWFWDCSGVFCIFLVEFVFGSADVSSWGDSVVSSIWLLWSPFSFSDGVIESELTVLCQFYLTAS